MCGICGYTGCIEADVLEGMKETLSHRGPDDFGIKAFGEAGLGHTRLSILDLSKAGRQPMSNEDESIWIAYNGEVYGHDELREALEEKGHRFRSSTDTEVIVHLYEEHGMKFLDHLRGFFALAIWDVARKKLILARDRLGIKPLYWTRLPGGGIAFASEIKALLRHPDVRRELDEHALQNYLTYLYVPPPGTMFKGIHKLAPGHVLTWQEGRAREEEYWDVPVRREDRADVRELEEELGRLLDEAVRLRMRSDVPLGAFLSGGLDSTAIVACMSRHSSRPVRTFTVVFDQSGRRYDEREYARMVAERFGTEHTEIAVTADVVELLPKIVRHFDEPFGNPTALLAYVLSGETRKHVTVVLGGDGGDEVFGGYPRYRGGLMASRAAAWLPGVVRRRLLPAVAGRLSDDTSGDHRARRIREFLSGLSLAPEKMYFSWINYWNRDELNRLLARGSSNGFDGEAFIESLFRRAEAVSFLDRLPYVDLKSFLPCNVLEYGDKMSMAHGLEMRVPLIDHRIVEFMAGLPFSLKVGMRKDKVLLRRLLKGKVPAPVLKRSKMGFNPPMGVWINRDLQPLVQDYLSPRQLKRRGLFDPNAVDEMLKVHGAGRRDMTWKIYALLILECWMRSYLD